MKLTLEIETNDQQQINKLLDLLKSNKSEVQQTIIPKKGYCSVCGIKLDNPDFMLCKKHYAEKAKEQGK
ncbi:MAG: hypothetical protein IMZ58_10315 [Thermoplasmata archaeon]|nr:hypothetical protein [Thermoplasmata archaeon]